MASDLPTADEAVRAVQQLAATRRGLYVHHRCNLDIANEGFDAESVFELLADCSAAEIHKIEPDQDLSRDNCVAVFRIGLEDGNDLYVKVALNLPHMSSGVVLSFKPWS